MFLSEIEPRKICRGNRHPHRQALSSMRRPKVDGRIPSTRKPSRPTLSPTTRYWRLAEAGHRPETDEHLGRAVKAMLAAQRPEGSWEGDPVYQGFNTPFRATQFAVMALSTLYPGTTKEKNWDAAYPAPATILAKNDLPLLLQQLDQFWDLAPEPVLRQIRKCLQKRPAACARSCSARAWPHGRPGRFAGADQGLGRSHQDGANQLRLRSSHGAVAPAGGRAEGRKMLAAALGSPDARTRWGAARVFNQHFRDLTDDPELLAALERDLNDPVPYVRFEAAGGLWRWYYWQVDQHRRPPRHARGARHAPQHGDGCDGSPRLAGEHLRSPG